jgi:RNA methyltransferase, TrmH family
MNLEYLTEKSGRVRQAIRYNSHAKTRRKDGIIMLDGIHVVREALEKLGVSALVGYFVTEDALSQYEVTNMIEDMEDRLGCVVQPNVMSKLATTVTPQGIVALFRRPCENSTSEEGLIVALENIQDPSNIGAMIRSGVSLGANAFILSKECADVWGPRALRASQGAHFSTRIFDNVDLEEAAKAFDGRVVATVLSSTAQSVFDTELSGNIMLVMGNEGIGITHELQQLCGVHVMIPMQGKFESLNVASACAIVCAERVRQTI